MKKILTVTLFLFTLTCIIAKDIPTLSQVGVGQLTEDILPVQAPFDMIKFERPVFPKRSVDIKSLGAKEGKLCTKIIQRAIDDLTMKGGGTVYVPEGKWLTGRIVLKTNVNLHLKEGAELYFSGDIKDYLPTVITRNEGIDMYSLGAFIYANNESNIALTGKGKLIGPSKECEIYKSHMNNQVIDSFILACPELDKRNFDGKGETPVFLPMFFSPIHCTKVFVEGVSFENSIFWNVVPVYCDHVIIRGVTVNSVGTPRGDGIDIDSSENVLIEYTTLNCGDDCFTIKAGRGEDGLRANRPSKNIVIRYCHAVNGPGGVTLGSETAGMISNVYVQDCVFENVHNGFYFKTRRSRGGGGENLYFERIRLVSPNTSFRWDMLGSARYVGDLAKPYPALPVGYLTPIYQNIYFKQIEIEQCQLLISATGIPESPLTNVVMTEINANCKDLIRAHNFDGLTIENSLIKTVKSTTNISEGRNMNFKDVKIDVFECLKNNIKLSSN